MSSHLEASNAIRRSTRPPNFPQIISVQLRVSNMALLTFIHSLHPSTIFHHHKPKVNLPFTANSYPHPHIFSFHPRWQVQIPLLFPHPTAQRGVLAPVLECHLCKRRGRLTWMNMITVYWLCPRLVIPCPYTHNTCGMSDNTSMACGSSPTTIHHPVNGMVVLQFSSNLVPQYWLIWGLDEQYPSVYIVSHDCQTLYM